MVTGLAIEDGSVNTSQGERIHTHARSPPGHPSCSPVTGDQEHMSRGTLLGVEARGAALGPCSALGTWSGPQGISTHVPCLR